MLVKKDDKATSNSVVPNFKNRYFDSEELQKPSVDQNQKSIRSAREKIDEILGVKKQAAYGTNIQKLGQSQSQIVKFASKGQTGQSNKERVIRIDQVQVDPLLPPQHKHRKLPPGPGSPPPPMHRSPSRKLTKQDMQDWKIPPCISNWKNSRGYTIPIHMRISADGRSLQHNTVNESFADIIDSLYVAERQAKSQIQQRAKVQKSIQYKEYLKKEENLRRAAMEARQEMKRIQEDENVSQSEEDDYKERQEFRYHRQRQLERENRMKKVGAERKKQIKKEERDISEKVALGQAQPTNQQLMLDQRLFDNAAGLQAGNSDSEDDNLYDKPLFADRSAVHAQTTSSQAADKGKRTQPVKFQMHKQSMFGMEGLLGKGTKKLKKQ